MKFVLIPLCCILAGVFLYQESKKKYVPAVVLKGLASLCFVILGYLCASKGSISDRIDVLLNLRLVFPKKGQLIFLVGILVFLAGHVLYLAAILPLSLYTLTYVIIGIILTALLMIWIFSRITAKPAFKIFGVVYIGAVVLLNCVAIGNMFTGPSRFTQVFAAGALLFLISDIVLILNTFGDTFKQSLRNTNIGLYYAGQLLIALSLHLMAIHQFL